MQQAASMEMQGLVFWESRSSCISHCNRASKIKKAISCIQSFGTLFAYFLNRMFLSLRGAETQMRRYVDLEERNLSKRKLVVCLHGLNNNPTQFKKIIEELEKRESFDADIFVPRILERGNAKLDEMTEPIFREIEKWGKTSGDKELTIVGVSNGGRISRALEARIVQSKVFGKIKKLRFLSIVGACKGSSLADFAKKFHLSWLMSRNISEEMPTDSPRSLRLDHEWKSVLSKGSNREYTFIASPHDWQVTNYSSSLMDIPQGFGHKTRYAIVFGHGHNSIVNAVSKAVAKII